MQFQISFCSVYIVTFLFHKVLPFERTSEVFVTQNGGEPVSHQRSPLFGEIAEYDLFIQETIFNFLLCFGNFLFFNGLWLDWGQHNCRASGGMQRSIELCKKPIYAWSENVVRVGDTIEEPPEVKSSSTPHHCGAPKFCNIAEGSV